MGSRLSAFYEAKEFRSVVRRPRLAALAAVAKAFLKLMLSSKPTSPLDSACTIELPPRKHFVGGLTEKECCPPDKNFALRSAF
jgi:hypothetical protein